MQATNGDDSAITSINVTTLVDIILVVLIIFMATAPLLHNRALKVEIPKAAHHERAATDALKLIFNAKKEIILGGKLVHPDQLGVILGQAVRAQPELRVSLSADKALAYGEIVGLLDTVKGAGVRKIGLEVAGK